MADFRKIDIKPFSYIDKNTDIKLWLKRFKWAVDSILDHDASQATKHAAYIQKLPTKLDDLCLQIYEVSENLGNWALLEAELIERLADPSKAQQFQDRLDSVKWDGESPLHLYENQIITSTRTLHPLVANNQLFAQETFKRFVAGLPVDYQNFIDVGLPPRTYDIKKARERAEKWQELVNKNEGKPALAFWLGGPQPQAFTGAAYKENPVEALSDKIDKMSLTHKENLEVVPDFQGYSRLESSSTKELSVTMDLNCIPENLFDPQNVCIPQLQYPWGLLTRPSDAL